jgi:hypothetical protein
MRVHTQLSTRPKRPSLWVEPPSKRRRCVDYDDDYSSSSEEEDDDSSSEEEDDDVEEEFNEHKRCVRFASTPYDASVDARHPRPTKVSCWWTRQDRAEFIEDCHETIREFRTDHMDQVLHYTKVFDQCCQAPSLASSDFLEQATLALPTEVRGLEWGIAPSSKSLRRDHVQEILEVQAQTLHLAASFRDRLLASRSVKSSRPSRIMARMLGDLDATAAATDRQQEEQESLLSSTVPVRRVKCRMMMR